MISPLRIVLLLLVLATAACSSSGDTSTGASDSSDTTSESSATASATPADPPTAEAPSEALVVAPSEDVIRLSPADTARALSDPATAEAGVWSVLANLGIGVYTGRGERVLGGSETSEDDFWLYDFEVPALVRMATSPAMPFAVTYARVSEVGFDGSQDDLLSFYRETYAAVPDAYLMQLFDAADIGFESDLELTQLEEWLLLLDTFVPPNGAAASEAAGADELQPVAVAAVLPREGAIGTRHAAYQDLCGRIVGGVVVSYWGEAWRGTTSGITAIDHHYAIHGLMLTSGVKASIEAEAPSAHEGHGAYGKPVDFVANVSLEYIPQPSLYVIDCGYLVNTDPPFIGPLPTVQVDWEPDDVLKEHTAVFGILVSFTDGSGDAKLTYVPREEKSKGRGLEQKETGSVTGTFNMKNALLALVQEHRILQLVPERMPILDVGQLEVRWHQANIRVSVHETEGPSSMVYEAWTCDGENWQASFEWAGQPGGADIEMFADFEFELPEGGMAINPVEASGGIEAAGVPLSMTIPYNFEFTLEGSDPFAVVGIDRQPGGGVTGPVGGQIPFPATSFPEFDFVAPLEENFECPE